MEDINTKIEDGGATADGRLSADEYNDRNEELENSVTRSGQALAPGNTEMLAESLFLNGTKATSFQDVGAANVVDLRPLSGASGVKVPTTYGNMNGVIVTFKPTANNTGATTLNIGQTAGIGAKALVLSTTFAALIGGELDTTLYSQAQYNLGADRWELLPWALPSASISFPILISQGGTGGTTAAAARTNLDVPPNTRNLTVSGLVTGGGTLASDRNFNVTISSQPQAEAGVDNTTGMTPLRVAQAIAALGGGGAIVGITNFTATGAAAYDPSINGASQVIIFATGGGAAGSGVQANSAGTIGSTGGGGAGATGILQYAFAGGVTSLALVIGAGGAGTLGANPGANTTVTEVGGGAALLIQADGGLAGPSQAPLAAPLGLTFFTGGLGSNVSTMAAGGLSVSGGDGSPGMYDVAVAAGGNGAASYWGDGGLGGLIGVQTLTDPNVVGRAGVAFGSGGGGAAQKNGGVGNTQVGFNGADGVVMVIEFA